MSRLLLFWVSAGGVILTITGGASNAVTAAVGVPLLYAVFTKVLDFLAKWELKGRRYSGDYIIWTENEDGSQLRAQDGDVDTLVDHQNALRIAQLLSDYGMFSPIAQYYECAQRLRESVRHGAATREDVDDFRENAEVCRQQGAVVRNRIFRYLAEVLAVEFAK